MEKVAIIDLGSNSVRMIIYKVMQDGHFMVLDEIKESVRLAQDMERDGFLKPARVGQAVKTLKMFKKLCDSQNVDRIIAVGTNAIRRAKNQKSFLEEIYATTGIKLRVLSVEEEAFHIYQGIINTLDIPKGLIVDISGSSIQLIYYNRRSILMNENLSFGALTLTDLFSTGEPLKPEEQAAAIEEFITNQLSRIEWIKTVDPDTQFIGVGGSFRNLGKIARRVTRYPLEITHNYHVEKGVFDSVYEMIKVLDADKRVKIKGLSTSRADIIASALASIKSIFGAFPNFNEIVISGCGLREGLMFNYAVPSTQEKPISDVLGHSIYTLIRHFDEDEKHSEQVFNLSIQLFKQLRVLHKLPRQYVKVLRTAALLHDIGQHLKYAEHHKHSMYFILNSSIYGITHREIVLAAFVSSMHRKDEFNMQEWVKYKDLVIEEDMTAVLKLGVILRIAESLDRSMSSSVKSLNCDVLGDSVIMKTEVEGDCSLEIKDALTAAPEFAKAYKKNLEIL